MKQLLSFVFLLFVSSIFSQSPSKPPKWSFLKNFEDSSKRYSHFELSFGQNLLFISPSKQNTLYNEASLVIPTSSILFFSEFRPKKILRVPLFLNIATESKQYLVNGELINEKAHPTIGTGLVFRVLQYRFDEQSKIELELGTLASLIIAKIKSYVAPVFAARLKICRGENFVMYIGTNYSLGVDAFGLMYGTGTVF